MGRKLDALLGRDSMASKFKTLAKLAISRIAILKNQRQVRCSHAQSDVIELLKLGHQERALLRVEHVIKEQNMLDVFAMIENYCDLLIERVALLKNKECHYELKEGISSLIFAASRCGEFPELKKIRQILTSRFGKDFADGAVELRNNCRVNPKMVQKLSVRQPSLEIRLKVLKGIASEIGVTLYFEEDAPVIAEEKLDVNMKQRQLEIKKSANLEGTQHRGDRHGSPAEETIDDDKLSESVKARKRYRDAAAAAQEAFEAAAYAAAAAARAAVELSRSESQDDDSDDYSGSAHRQGTISNSNGSMTPKFQTDGYAASREIKHSNNSLGFDMIHPIDNFSSEPHAKKSIKTTITRIEFDESKNTAGIVSKLSASSSDSGDDIFEGEGVAFELSKGSLHDLGSQRNPIFPMTHDAIVDEDLSDEKKGIPRIVHPMERRTQSL